ncbi:MAG: hypothetical protein Q7K45_04445 [Nanoarchaeota archaeon]|nr:hypothetical protein [Nanoarchaeota archaeon]
MGWLFGNKKVPKVPFPEGRSLDENSLRLPGRLSSSRVIEPDQIKEAAGFGKAMTFPDEEEFSTSSFPSPRASSPVSASRTSMPSAIGPQEASPLFVKVEVYQHILGEIDEVKSKITELNHINKSVETSEYNEEHNFVKLRRCVKGIHDRLLLADKIVFKA